MGKIEARLLETIEAASEPQQRFDIMVHLAPDVEWSKGLLAAERAGLEIRSTAVEIRTVFGRATADAVRRIAEQPEVRLVEGEAEATIQGP